VGRALLLWVLLALALLGLGVMAADGVTVKGRIDGTEQEKEEGYFAIGPETMVVAKPGSDLHKWLQSQAGRQVTLTLQSDMTTE
jgi:hypothetical protein